MQKQRKRNLQHEYKQLTRLITQREARRLELLARKAPAAMLNRYTSEIANYRLQLECLELELLDYIEYGRLAS